MLTKAVGCSTDETTEQTDHSNEEHTTRTKRRNNAAHQNREPFRTICNLTDQRDLALLKNWASFHWDSTIKPCVSAAKSVYFHDCCFCFSRRGFMHRSNHPTESTFSYFKMYDLKACNHSEDFASWIIEKLSQEQKEDRSPTSQHSAQNT